MNSHLREAAVRIGAIEEMEARLALGQLLSTSDVHTGLARLAQRAGLHLRIATEEMGI